jgi:uncharacterized membrane protein
MGKGRMEAFTDGVIAIIITIMVLEMKVPQSGDIAALWPELPLFIVCAVCCVNVGIFGNNHHHLLHATERIAVAGMRFVPDRRIETLVIP